MPTIRENEEYQVVSIEKYGRYYKKMSDTLKYKAYLGKALSKVRKEEIIAADEICDIMAHLISGYKGIPCAGLKEHYDQWFEILVSAAYLYSHFYDDSYKYTSVVRAREDTENIAKEAGLAPVESEYIFQAVESALGFYGPQKWKTVPDSPSEMLVLAIYLYDNWKTLKEPID